MPLPLLFIGAAAVSGVFGVGSQLKQVLIKKMQVIQMIMQIEL